MEYAALGITAEHTSQLIRLATDPRYLDGDEAIESTWTPLQAWRALAELKDTESAPLMEKAFETDRVDRMMGDWEDIQVEMGLLSERTTPRTSHWRKAPIPPDYSNRKQAAQKKKEQGRRLNKQARKTRKKNRPRK